MTSRNEFVVGRQYSNDQIRFALDVGNLGGVRPSTDKSGNLRHIALMTSSEEGRPSKYVNPYHDRVEGDILIFTGTGRKGDQSLSGANKRIIEQYTAPIPILGFINQGKQSYEFLGLLHLLRHYQEQQIDQKGKIRVVWVFEFRIHKSPETVPLEIARELSAQFQTTTRTDEGEREVVLQSDFIDKPNRTLVAEEELRSQLLEVSPIRFEHLIKAVIERVGFVDVSVTKPSGDGGVDLNATVGEESDFFRGTFVQFQAKRWRHAVGTVDVNNFRGALSSTAKGVFITTSRFTKGAFENATTPQKSCVTLLDGPRFAKILLRSGVDVFSI